MAKEINKEVEVYRRLYGNVISKITQEDDTFLTTIKVGKEFELVEVSSLCYPSKYFEDDEGRVRVQATFKQGKKWKKCFVDIESSQNLMKTLRAMGFALINNDSLIINLFTTHFMNLYQVLTHTKSARLVKQLGWQGKRKDFALGNEYISSVEKDGKHTYEVDECEVHEYLDGVNSTLKVTGSQEEFKRQIENIFALDLPKHHAYFLCGISTPALGLIRRQGTVVNFQSTVSSIGKSLIQKCAKLCYFDNDSLIRKYTYNGVVEELRKHNNFPFFLEEISGAITNNPQEIIGFVHDMTGGISKLRSSETGKNRDVNTFATSLLTSSNPDIFSIIDSESEAELVRVLQISIDQEEGNYIKNNLLQKKLGKIKDMLEKNHGHGRDFIITMLKTNYNEVFEEEYEKVMEEFDLDDFRYVGFVIANAITFALLLEGMQYNINIQKIRDAFSVIIEELKKTVKSKKMNGSSALQRILSMLQIQHFIKTSTTGMPVTDENYPNYNGKYDGQLINGNELIIPKEIFEEKVCSSAKSKGKNLINLSSNQLLQMFNVEKIQYEIKQKRYNGSKFNCIVITLPDSLKRTA